MAQHQWDDDENLLGDLTEAVGEAASLAPSVAAAGAGAFAWRTVDTDLLLASLSFDSSLEHSLELRAEADDSRVLVFTATPLTVELEVLADRVVGQIVPPGRGEVRMESADGVTLEVEADDAGFFRLPGAPRGPVRLRCDTPTGRLVTDWVRL